MTLRLALLAVVLRVVLEFFLGLEAHAETMLPDIASLALHHEFSAVRIFLCKGRRQ